MATIEEIIKAKLNKKYEDESKKAEAQDYDELVEALKGSVRDVKKAEPARDPSSDDSLEGVIERIKQQAELRMGSEENPMEKMHEAEEKRMMLEGEKYRKEKEGMVDETPITEKSNMEALIEKMRMKHGKKK